MVAQFNVEQPFFLLIFVINYTVKVVHMKIFLAQQNYHIGNFEYNTNKIIEAIEIAKAQQADLIVFSEIYCYLWLSCKRCRV